MLRTILLAAISASVLVSAQGPPSGTAGCTALSFALPSWFITSFQVTISNASSYNATRKPWFTLTNRASNYTADLTCLVEGSGSSDCTVGGTTSSSDVLLTAVELTATQAQVFVNQAWNCSDRTGAKLAPFEAYGNTAVTLSNNGKAVDLPLLVQASLTSPVAITPIRAWGPTGHDNVGCAAPDKSSWALSVPFYTNQTGDGANNVASQDFTVLVTNVATGYEASCMSGGFGDGLTPTPATGPLNLVCAGAEFQSSGGGRYSITTAASFDPYTFRFTVNQTWFCDESDPAKPVRITATSSDILPLSCTSTLIGNPDSGPRDTRYSCIHYDNVMLEGKHTTETALQPYSLQDPVPGPDDCTLSSIFRPQWTFSTFEVDSSPTAPQSVSFEMILRTGSPGFQFPIAIAQGVGPLAGEEEGWYTCVVGPSGNIGEVLWPSTCSFRYVAATKELSLKADWACAEYDPNHPILFSGVTTTTVNTSLLCDTVDGFTRCLTENGGYRWTADTANVTWQQ